MSHGFTKKLFMMCLTDCFMTCFGWKDLGGFEPPLESIRGLLAWAPGGDGRDGTGTPCSEQMGVFTTSWGLCHLLSIHQTSIHINKHIIHLCLFVFHWSPFADSWETASRCEGRRNHTWNYKAILQNIYKYGFIYVWSWNKSLTHMPVAGHYVLTLGPRCVCKRKV